MKKYDQKCENLNAEIHLDMFHDEMCSAITTICNEHQLRSCSATVFDLVDDTTGEVLYHVLRSYNTIVAFIDPTTDTLYDVLRKVYGYTSTSAQHIAKFNQDCGGGKWGCANRVTYRDI